MDLSRRADIVRALRVEIKQDRDAQARGFALMDRTARLQRRVRGGLQRAGDRVGAWADRELEAHRRRDTAHLRATNMRHAERVRREGYDISPEFRARSRAAAVAATAASYRAQAGTGSNRWRGSVAEVGREARAARPTRAPAPTALIDQVPGEATFPAPRRTVEGTVTYHDRSGRRTQRTRTDRPPRRGR